MMKRWTVPTLHEALQSHQSLADNSPSFEIVGDENALIKGTFPDHGGLEMLVAVEDEIILVQTSLFPAERVADTAALNDCILRTERFFDLANISIDETDAGDMYVMYGSLRTTSALDDVLFEMSSLASNATQAAQALSSFLH